MSYERRQQTILLEERLVEAVLNREVTPLQISTAGVKKILAGNTATEVSDTENSAPEESE